jgi:anti-sigma regulatory factor (Ser/Thr protein kinase)
MAMTVHVDRGRRARIAVAASGGQAPPVLWWGRDFPGGEDQVRQVRHWIEDLLPQCDPLAEIVLLASELCTNAVMHTRSGNAGGRFTVDVEWAPWAARVVVGDQRSLTAPAKTEDATWAAEHGRGLWLVDELADDWGTASHPGHRWTWAGIQWQAKGGRIPGDPAGCEAAWTDVTGLREVFPGTTIWWGHQTRTWWAAIPGASDAGGLVGAATRGDLRRKLAATYTDSGSSRDDAR